MLSLRRISKSFIIKKSKMSKKHHKNFYIKISLESREICNSVCKSIMKNNG